MKNGPSESSEIMQCDLVEIQIQTFLRLKQNQPKPTEAEAAMH